jgi:hypothetical protein
MAVGDIVLDASSSCTDGLPGIPRLKKPIIIPKARLHAVPGRVDKTELTRYGPPDRDYQNR